MRVKTLTIQGRMSLVDLALINAHPVLLCRDAGARYPDMKKIVAITKISRTIFTSPERLLTEGSSTIQNDAQRPLLSYTPPA